MRRPIFILATLGILAISAAGQAIEPIASPDTTLNVTLWRPDRINIKDRPFVGPPAPPPWWKDPAWWKCNEVSYRSPCFWTSTAVVIVGGIVIYSLIQKNEGGI